jgi:two-component SAPR family response regulator
MNKQALYTSVLSKDARLEAINTGMAIKAASMGKRAQVLNEIADIGTKGLITASLVTGIPLGIMTHYVAKRVKRKRQKEHEMDEKIKYYQTAADEIERGLAANNATY